MPKLNQLKQSFQLSVVIPCFNEEKTISELLIRVLNQSEVTEVIVIDDNSTDFSVELIQKVSSPKIRLIVNEKNSGKGACVSRGIQEATGDFVLIQDADLEYSPEEYPRLLKPLIDGRADAVFGSRFLTFEARHALYFWHRMGNAFLTLLSNIFTNVDLTDMETCYKVMKINYGKALNIQEPRFGLEPEITAKLAAMKARIYEVPISYQGRTYEEGKKITWKDGFSALRCIVKYSLPREQKKVQRLFESQIHQ
jgi:glycosyltransferase involved in cell wall biosynthesis